MPSPPHTPDRRPALGALDVWIGAALALAFGLLYAATLQHWLWNDGFFVAKRLEWNEPGLWPHPAYLPVARAFNVVLPGPGPYEGLFATSWTPGAAAIGLLFLVARAFGAARLPSVFAAALWAVTPAHWFFSTTIEVHTLHAAGVALAALIALRAPWRRGFAGIAAAAAGFFLVPLTHLMAPLLAPGWIALCALSARAAGAPLGMRRLALGLIPLLALGGVVAFALTSLYYWNDSVLGGFKGTAAQIEEHLTEGGLVWWRDDVLKPLGPALIAIAAGVGVLTREAVRGRGSAAEPRAAWFATRPAVLALAIVPLTAFTAWWAVPNEGGYLLGTAPFFATVMALGAAGPVARWPRWVWIPLAAVLLGWTGYLGYGHATRWRSEHVEQRRDERAAQVRLILGDRGVLVSFDTWKQPVGLDVRGVRESQRVRQVQDALRDSIAPSDVMADIAWKTRALALEHPEGVAIDLHFRALGAINPYLRPFADALEAELVKYVELEEFPHPRWPMARVRAREP